MTIAEVLKNEAAQATITVGYVTSYAVRRDGKVVAFAEGKLANWKMVWTVHVLEPDGKISNKVSLDLNENLAKFGAVDLTRTGNTGAEAFFRMNPPG